MGHVLGSFYQDKVVFITGAGSGLGRSLSLLLSEMGAKLIITDQNAKNLEEVVALVSKKTGCQWGLADVTNKEELLKLKLKIPANWSVDIVIANAGVGGINPADCFSSEIDQTIMKVNYFGVVNTLSLFVEEMKQKKSGHLVGISSLASLRGLPSACSYSASKAAVNNFLESWRLDLAPFNIKVSCVRPGFIKSPMTNHQVFPLPFMVNSEEAAEKVLLSIAKYNKTSSFPWPMAVLSFVNKWLPNFLYDFLLPKINPRKKDTILKPRIF